MSDLVFLTDPAGKYTLQKIKPFWAVPAEHQSTCTWSRITEKSSGIEICWYGMSFRTRAATPPCPCLKILAEPLTREKAGWGPKDKSNPALKKDFCRDTAEHFGTRDSCKNIAATPLESYVEKEAIWSLYFGQELTFAEIKEKAPVGPSPGNPRQGL